MGNELRHFVPEFLQFRKDCKKENLNIPFLFHCGETLDVGDKVDGNLFDAILLNSKRIGHGYALARHPLLMEIFKEKNIAIESCPISNEILGLTPTIAGHNLPILLANNVPCTINSDNATFYKYVPIISALLDKLLIKVAQVIPLPRFLPSHDWCQFHELTWLETAC
jgi:adenosine deaminase CECR1